MANFSFDIVSEVDLQEVDNAVNQAKKELSQRFDFKNSKSTFEYDRKEKKIVLTAEDDYKLKALKDMLGSKLIKRGISTKSLNYKEPEKIFGDMKKQIVDINTGIPREKAKELVSIIKGLRLKVQAAIEEEKIRVSGAKKDDLQAVITHLRAADFSLPLTFQNYR